MCACVCVCVRRAVSPFLSRALSLSPSLSLSRALSLSPHFSLNLGACSVVLGLGACSVCGIAARFVLRVLAVFFVCFYIAICVCLVRRRRCSVCSRVARCVFRRCLRPAVRVVAFSFCLCMLRCCLLALFFVRAIFSFVLHSVVCSGRASGSSFSLRVPRLSLSVSSWNRTSFRVL